jgi:ribonucleoside-diphosphate reductase alpha chain
MPVGQSGESQQWMTASMRLLSLAARGGFLDRALDDLRKVAWDRGPVRLGHHTKEDGTKIPMWHDSEVSALAFAIQNVLKQRAARGTTIVGEISTIEEPEGTTMPVMAGKKCRECGAHAVIKADGCEKCTACGWMGSCG